MERKHRSLMASSLDQASSARIDTRLFREKKENETGKVGVHIGCVYHTPLAPAGLRDLTREGIMEGASLTCPCTRCPATVRPGVSSSPCISVPNCSTSPVTSGSNVQVVLVQVFPM